MANGLWDPVLSLSATARPRPSDRPTDHQLTDGDRKEPDRDRTMRRLTFGAAGPLIVREVSYDRLD